MTVSANERLRELRRENKLTQDALARLVNERHGLGWYQSTVQKLEAGTREPSLSDLEALADVYGMTLDAMLYGHEYGIPKTDEFGGDPDPMHRAASDREDSWVRGLRYERQFHILRIAEIDDEIARRRDYPGDAYKDAMAEEVRPADEEDEN